MELCRVVLDNGDEISITENNRSEFLSDPQEFKRKWLEIRKEEAVQWDEFEKFYRFAEMTDRLRAESEEKSESDSE